MTMKNLQINGDDWGAIRAKKIVNVSKIWLTEKPDATWWIVVDGPDQKIRTVGFVRPPQEQRARTTYDDLNQPHVLGAFLEGRDS
jgi:hypothetical protein